MTMEQLQTFNEAKKQLQKDKLSIYNRLHSIYEDAKWISSVAAVYAPLPIVANERCGSWYVNPSIKSPYSAYFKSTDGHFGRWEFSLRRANLHLLPVIQESKGIVIVDSTRRGKRYPDALSKTIPMWCAVINAAIKQAFDLGSDWDVSLYTSPRAVSRSEHDQMSLKLEQSANALVASSFKLPQLSKPLRPMWLTPDTQVLPISSDLDFLPVICVSASKLVDNDGVDRRRFGYTYVQGSGDDHELWSQGLQPDTMWKNLEQLLNTPSDQLSAVVEHVVQDASPMSLHSTLRHEEGEEGEADGGTQMRMTMPMQDPTMTNRLKTHPIAAVQSRLRIGLLTPGREPILLPDDAAGYIIISTHDNGLNTTNEETKKDHPSKPILHLTILPGKRGRSAFLAELLPKAIRFASGKLEADTATMGIVCEDGKDLSVGITMAIMQALFDEQGEYVGVRGLKDSDLIDKSSIRKRLEWIQASYPMANPSRTTLKWLNEYFMSGNYDALLEIEENGQQM